MSLRGRVGRHTQAGGRQCQNWSEDQQTVIALLNQVPVSAGGAGGSLGGRIVSGLSSDALYRAISQFEDKQFPGQRSGFVDPGGPMLRRMEQLAGPAASAPPVVVETPLDILRRNVLDETQARTWPAGERVAFDPLVTMAVRHIDALKDQGLEKLPWGVELFGRAYVTMEWRAPIIYANDDEITWDAKDDPGGPRLTHVPPLPEMSYGGPISSSSYIFTGKLSALLLLQNGRSYRIRRYHEARSPGLMAWPPDQILGPMPIFGAEHLGVR